MRCGPRKAIRRLNEEPNGFYATRMPGLQYNPRGCHARIRAGRLEINFVGAGEPDGIRKDGYLDVTDAKGFIDAYGQSIYAD